jgi:hypothetical protein
MLHIPILRQGNPYVPPYSGFAMTVVEGVY